MMPYGGNWKAKMMLNLKLKNHEIPCGKCGLQLLPLYVERLEHRGMQGRVRRYVPALLGQMERTGGKIHLWCGGTILHGTFGRQPEVTGETCRLDM